MRHARKKPHHSLLLVQEIDTRKFVAKTCENQGTGGTEQAWELARQNILYPIVFVAYIRHLRVYIPVCAWARPSGEK